MQYKYFNGCLSYPWISPATWRIPKKNHGVDLDTYHQMYGDGDFLSISGLSRIFILAWIQSFAILGGNCRFENIRLGEEVASKERSHNPIF